MTEAEARAIAAPDLEGRNWPMSEDAKRWVEFVMESQKPEHERKFDKDAFKSFGRQFK